MASNGAKQKNADADLNVKSTSPLVAAFIHPETMFWKLDDIISIEKLAMFFVVYLIAGTLCFYLSLDDIKGLKTSPIIDALYLSVVTMTTVGYGDLVPNTAFVKLLSCVFVFAGMCLVGLLLTKVADYLLEKQKIMLVQALTCKPEKNVPVYKKDAYKCLFAIGVLSGVMIVGTMFLYSVEKMDLIDAIYCVCSTVSTIGYGDKSFSSQGGRVFGIVWIATGTLSLGQLFVYVAELLIEKRRRSLVHWGIANFDMEAARDTEAAELVLDKLKEMGKISEEGVSSLMKEFEDLDVYKSGFLAMTSAN